jgi:hypothetical protein
MAHATAHGRMHDIFVALGITREMVEQRVALRRIGGPAPRVCLYDAQYSAGTVAAMLELVAERAKGAA